MTPQSSNNTFQLPFNTSNANGDAAVTRLCDMTSSKKSLPAPVSPVTLRNKVAAQRQATRD
jgi:hypothetical protein